MTTSSRDVLIVAHAGGLIGGEGYTNSLEACFRSLSAGFRFIELDVIALLDAFAIAHDGLESRYYGFSEPFNVISLEQFQNSKVLRRLTPMTFSTLDRLAKVVNGTSWILDTKFARSAELYEFLIWLKGWYPALVRCCIIQVYSIEDGMCCVSAGFNRMIFALWKNFHHDSLGSKAVDAVKAVRDISGAKLVGTSLRLYVRKGEAQKSIDDTRVGELRAVCPQVILHELRDADLSALWANGYGLFIHSERSLGFDLLLPE